jgi:4-hydroxy-tetrahydrodipicolinate synthase
LSASRLSKLFEAAQAGDMALTRTLHSHVMDVSEDLYRVGLDSSTIIRTIKCSLSVLGI